MLEKGCIEALEQIENLHYENNAKEEGYQDILKYDICFYKKECLVIPGNTQKPGEQNKKYTE